MNICITYNPKILIEMSYNENSWIIFGSVYIMHALTYQFLHLWINEKEMPSIQV